MEVQLPRLRQRWLSAATALAIFMGGCGDDEPAVAPSSVTSVVSESTSARSSVVEVPVEPPSDASSSVDATASDDGRVEAVIVASGPDPGGSSWWLLVDVTDGTTVDGASRLAVEAASSELVCGDDGRRIDPIQLEAGEAVSFESHPTQASLPAHLTGDEWESAVIIGGGKVRSICPPGNDEAVAALAEQRAKWEATGITNYEFTLFWGQLNLLYGDYRVTVVDGRPAGVLRMDPGELAPGWEAEVPGTIDEVFDVLQPWVGGADQVDASYDPDSGYPVAVRIDRIENAVDDEFEMRISDLTVGTG